MIVASHQPNFLPYMGFVYKMYCSDIFTLSTGVQFTRNGFHNYNYIDENGSRAKVTVPVKSHSGKISDVLLAEEWEQTKAKVLKRILTDYRKSPHFWDAFLLLENAFKPTYTHLEQLNMALLESIRKLFGMECIFVNESMLDLEYKSPNEDIVKICKQTGCNQYLSGSGAMEYLNENMLNFNRIEVLWSKYKPFDYGSRIENASVIDYIMLKGNEIPDSWKRDREAYHERKNV